MVLFPIKMDVVHSYIRRTTNLIWKRRQFNINKRLAVVLFLYIIYYVLCHYNPIISRTQYNCDLFYLYNYLQYL